MLKDAEFSPPRWLRNPHVQTVLASSAVRRMRPDGRPKALARSGEPITLALPDDVRLRGMLNRCERRNAPMAVVFHGWEGCVESTYVIRQTIALLARGFDVFRLNFRDHGATHELNPDIFHSCRIAEVVDAVKGIQDHHARGPILLAGYSLGGNFALRVGLHAPSAGIELSGIGAVCPVINPHTGLFAIESAPAFYQSYFLKKWRRSLRAKEAAFPDRFRGLADLADAMDMRALTSLLVERYTDYGALEDYLDGYAIYGDRLQGLQVPATILTARDDPIIPIADFENWQLPPSAKLFATDAGGHCAFVASWSLDGFAERFIADALESKLPDAGAHEASSPAQVA